MTRQEIIETLEVIRDTELAFETEIQAIDEAIYYIGIIDELKHERDAALDTAYAALKIRKEKKDG